MSFEYKLEGGYCICKTESGMFALVNSEGDCLMEAETPTQVVHVFRNEYLPAIKSGEDGADNP